MEKDHQKLLNACKEYRAKVDELEKENAKLKDELKEEKIDRSLDGWNEAGIINDLKRENAELKETTKKHVAAYYDLLDENAALRKALSESDVVAEYSRDDGQREWWIGGYWLHTGEMLVCIDRAAFDTIQRKEAQS